jgi:hypothetical protein
LSQDAADTLARQSERLRLAIADHLLDPAESPATLSRPSRTPPHPPGFQVYEFKVVDEDHVRSFAVLFRYGTDEETLHVHEIGHVRYESS